MNVDDAKSGRVTGEELDREWNAAEFLDHREEILIDGEDTRVTDN
jgi:hypothetical protein